MRSWNVDTIPPTVLLNPSFGPSEGALQGTTFETFAFSAGEAVLRFECRLDSVGQFQTCTSPHMVSGLGAGPHKFEVRAADLANNTGPPTTRNWSVAAQDLDGDGFVGGPDCNDANANINPGRADIPDNGVDENCDGQDAEDLDRDRDGVQRPADCDDNDPGRNPGRTDLPGNGVDENCDGQDAEDLDRDRDGVLRGADCDDNDATRNPGVVDVPGNGRDEDCDGRDAALPHMPTSLSNTHAAARRFTRFSKLQVVKVPASSRIAVTCKGKKCPRKRWVRTGGGTVKLKPFIGRKLPPGTVLDVRVTNPAYIGIVRLIKIRRGKAPKVDSLCLPPGAPAPEPCEV